MSFRTQERVINPREKETLFPKITGKHVDFLHQLRRLKERNKLPRILNIEGTVKLHGMHADILFDLNDTATSNDRAPLSVRFQSRNRLCTPDEDQQGWPREVAQYPGALAFIRDWALDTFRQHNPTTSIDTTCPMIIAGEWIGERVQRDVGIAQLSKRFVVLSASVNGVWQQDAQYKDLQAVNAGIHNIFICGSLGVKFDTADLSESNPALLEMQMHADMVETSCPFAAKFGVLDSGGEGIVWKPGVPEGRADPKCWLKTKGPIHGKENRIDPRNIAKEQEIELNVDQIVQRWVTPRRVKQGFEYLLEMNMYPTQASLKEYMNWMVHDIVVEEKDEIMELKRRWPDIEKIVKSKVMHAAREAYMKELDISGEELGWAAWYHRSRRNGEPFKVVE
ncbi:hypothetical protein LTR64_007529 [Lithohypha guttulata]|uniref:uncharacterized protein n=1 Tax=Lithohypha guttulata TaxID=1690604 RepID=UPI002DDE091E|nr:hypothetical protein LTR51_007039 [Lithohypha guttulata]